MNIKGKTALLLMIFAILFTSCDRNSMNVCVKQVETNTGHLISDKELIKMGYKVDIIENSGDFQIRIYNTDQYGSVAKCNQFYNGLPIFTGDVNFVFSNNSGLIIAGDIIDSVGILLKPQIDYKDAADVAHKEIQSKKCYRAELGIYDLNAGTGNSQPDFELTWKITPKKNDYPYAMVSAETGEVFRYDDGIRI